MLHVRIVPNGSPPEEGAPLTVPADMPMRELLQRAASVARRPLLQSSVLYAPSGKPVRAVADLEDGGLAFYEATGAAFVRARPRDPSLDGTPAVAFSPGPGDDAEALMEGARRAAPASADPGWGTVAPHRGEDLPASPDHAPTDALKAQPPAAPSYAAVAHATRRRKRPLVQLSDVAAGPALHLNAKCVILGSSAVGKTSLMQRLAGRALVSGSTAPTVGVDNIIRRFQMGPHLVELSVWDTAGQEKFRSITKAYLRDTAVAVFVYDVSCFSTFSQVSSWLSLFRSQAGTEEAVTVLVANKLDTPVEQHEVEGDRAEQFAAQEGMLFFSVSALFSPSIDAVFESAVLELIRRLQQQQQQQQQRADKPQAQQPQPQPQPHLRAPADVAAPRPLSGVYVYSDSAGQQRRGGVGLTGEGDGAGSKGGCCG